MRTNRKVTRVALCSDSERLHVLLFFFSVVCIWPSELTLMFTHDLRKGLEKKIQHCYVLHHSLAAILLYVCCLVLLQKEYTPVTSFMPSSQSKTSRLYVTKFFSLIIFGGKDL